MRVMRVAGRRTKAKREQLLPVLPTADGALPTLDAVFAEVRENALGDKDVPEVVRRNRRERAKRRLRDALETRGPYPLNEALVVKMRSLVERWAQKGFVDAFPEADEFEIRCAEERAILDAAARGDARERFVAAERAYLREIEEKYGRIEIRGLQLSARVYQDLEIAYVPLHVEDTSPPVEKKNGKGRGKDEPTNDFLAEMARRLGRSRIPAARAVGMHARLLLIGAPGSGKSTLLAYLAARAARGQLAVDAGLTTNPVPFVLPVRSLVGVPTNLDELAQAAHVEAWFFEQALQNARGWLFVDGLDEARPEIATKLLDTIEALLNAYPDVRVLVTSRPSGVPGGIVPAPANYARAELLPMTRDDVTRFIKQWCLAAELSLSKARDEAENDARHAADDLMERVRASRAIEKLAQTPLLCSVICIVHRFLGQRIPERRVVLYDAITNVLLYEWDRAKFTEGAATGKLDAHAKRALLARLARSMHEARTAEIPTGELIEKFAAHLPHLGHAGEDAARIVAEIRDRNGILVERSPGQFAFSHLTFQEYLTAFDIVNARDFAMVVRKYRDKWWHEVIVLAAGFPGANAELIVRGLLRKDGDHVGTGTMLAAQCTETAIELPAALRSEIEKRVATLIPPRTPEAYGALLDLGDVVVPVLLRALDKVDTDGKASSILLLTEMNYEPIVNITFRYWRDTGMTSPGVPITRESVSPGNLPLALFAAIAACLFIHTSDAAFIETLKAMPSAGPNVIGFFRYLCQREEVSSKRRRLQSLIDEYERTHPKPAAPAPAPKRAARSG